MTNQERMKMVKAQTEQALIEAKNCEKAVKEAKNFWLEEAAKTADDKGNCCELTAKRIAANVRALKEPM